jgi:hypothetical protein
MRASGKRVDHQGMGERSSLGVLAPILFAAAAAEILIATGAGLASDRGWTFLLNHFVVTNAVIGGSLAVSGWPIAWQRPRNPIGWLAAAGRRCVLCRVGCCVLLAGLGVAHWR